MHAILVSMGTAGDVYPFIGLGIALKERGHDVTLVANERFARFADRYGFGFVTFVSEEATEQLLGNPGIWRPLKSALVGARWARVRLREQFEVIQTAVQSARDPLLVAYAPIFAARVVQELTGTRIVSLVPMPWMIPSVTAPPRMAGVLDLPNAAPRPLRDCYWWGLKTMTDHLIGRYVNKLRKSVDLPPVRDVAGWSFSPEMTIGMFPEWYAPIQPDWPDGTVQVGFSSFDGAEDASLPKHVLDFCQQDEQPIAFTFGTGMQYANQLFQKAAEICQEKQWRAIFLSPHRAQVPTDLPNSILVCQYAPFHQLLPHCRALVHHGGIGTTAQAFAAGIPQLITPFAWDQYDNAARVKRLRAGNWCQPSRSRRRWATLLESILTYDQLISCRNIAARMQDGDASRRAAKLLEGLVANRR